MSSQTLHIRDNNISSVLVRPDGSETMDIFLGANGNLLSWNNNWTHGNISIVRQSGGNVHTAAAVPLETIIDGLESGTDICRFTVNLPAIDGSEGLRLTFRLGINVHGSISGANITRDIPADFISQAGPVTVTFGVVLGFVFSGTMYPLGVAFPPSQLPPTCKDCGKHPCECKEQVFHTVTLDSGLDDLQTISVLDGQAIGALPRPEKEGHLFAGWWTDDGTQVTPDTVVTSDMSLLARWEEKRCTPPSKVYPLENDPNVLEIEIFRAERFESNETGPCVEISSRAHRPLVLVGHDGLTSPPNELAHLDHAVLDGGIIGGTRAKSRRITLDFVVKDRGYPEIASLFPLGQKWVIKVARENAVRIIEGYRDGAIEVSAASALATPMVSVSFLCPSPYFRNDVVREGEFNRPTGGLKYPIAYPLTYGTLTGDGSATLYNRGDYPAPFVLEMTAGSDGDLEIVIDDKAVAWINGVLANQRIVLDTRTKMLWVNKQKRFSAFNGVFPRIPLGESRISLRGLSGLAVLHYSEIFEGV